MIDVKWQDYITADPAIMVGKPIIRGTRITVELIVEKLGYGETVDEMLEDYPHLTRVIRLLRSSPDYYGGERTTNSEDAA